MASPRLIRPLSILLMALSVTIVAISKWRPPPSPNRALHSDIGKALAREALPLLGKGGKVWVFSRDTAAFPQPALEISFRAFQKEIAAAGAVIAKVQALEVDPLRPVEVPPGDFFEAIRQAGSNDVIVSFLGPPLLSDEQRSRLGPIKPKIVAFIAGTAAAQISLAQLAEAGLLHAAVVGRTEVRKSDPAQFDDLYRSVKSTDLQSGK